MPAKKAGKAVKERPAVKDLTFEQAYRELEEVVAQLEGEGLTLDESLGLFARGQELAARCNQQLDDAELRVQQLERGELTPLSLPDDQTAA